MNEYIYIFNGILSIMKRKEANDGGHNRSIYINRKLEKIVEKEAGNKGLSFSAYLTEIILDTINNP